MARMSKAHGLAAHCLPLFFVHKPDATALVPPLVMPVYNIFFHECLPYSIDNVWLIFCAKLVSCGHAMTWFSRTCGFEQAQRVVCLCFFWHNPNTNALVPPSAWKSGPVRFFGPLGPGPRPRLVCLRSRTEKDRTGLQKTEDRSLLQS